MLELHVQPSELSQRWTAHEGGWICGSSFISPIEHPMLQSFSLSSPTRTAFIVRERGPREAKDLRLDEDGFDRQLTQAQAWPLQYTLVVLDHHDESLAIRQGLWGTAPVYLMEHSGSLRGHWDPCVFYPLLDDLDRVRALRFLRDCDMPYGRRTLFHELHLITCGACVRWGEERALEISYPQATPPPRARKLRKGARPEVRATDVLRSSLKRWIHPDVVYGAELSGGLDSSLVAITATEQIPHLRTFGIHLDDAVGQRERRQSMIDRFNLQDTTVDLADHLPLSPASPRWQGGPTVPWEEIYDEAVRELLGRARDTGVVAMFTGFGGDELCPLYANEPPPPPEMRDLEPASEARHPPNFLGADAGELLANSNPDAAPPAILDASSLESAAFGSSLYLRHGIWPIHPLCTPQLVSLTSALPWTWRVGRNIERSMLHHLGCPSVVADARTVDSFLRSLAHGLRYASREQLVELFEDPLIAEMGLVDGYLLQHAYEGWCSDGGDEAAVGFYSAACLELALRAVGTPA